MGFSFETKVKGGSKLMSSSGKSLSRSAKPTKTKGVTAFHRTP